MKTAHENRRHAAIKGFIENGFEGMSREQALELLFFYTMPSVSMRDAVDKLFADYPSFVAITNAEPEKLMRDYGLDEGTATLLHVLPDIIREYGPSDKSVTLESASAAMEYFMTKLRYEPIEKLMACFLNDRLGIIGCETISVGSVKRTAVNTLEIIAAANKAGSRAVIIAHNHPTQTAQPSVADTAVTRTLRRDLKDVGIELLDHIIISSDGTSLSMKNAGFFPLLDN